MLFADWLFELLKKQNLEFPGVPHCVEWIQMALNPIAVSLLEL
jgi:hypothetical protein